LDVCELLRTHRKSKGLTQLDVANAVGVSEATVSRWESGDIENMRRDKIAALSRILGLKPGVIAGYDEGEQGDGESPALKDTGDVLDGFSDEIKNFLLMLDGLPQEVRQSALAVTEQYVAQLAQLGLTTPRADPAKDGE